MGVFLCPKKIRNAPPSGGNAQAVWETGSPQTGFLLDAPSARMDLFAYPTGLTPLSTGSSQRRIRPFFTTAAGAR